MVHIFTQSFFRVLESVHTVITVRTAAVYFGDACEAALFQHVFMFQNLTSHLYFRWGFAAYK